MIRRFDLYNLIFGLFFESSNLPFCFSYGFKESCRFFRLLTFDMTGSYYETLGVSVNATAEELKRACSFGKFVLDLDIVDWL